MKKWGPEGGGGAAGVSHDDPRDRTHNLGGPTAATVPREDPREQKRVKSRGGRGGKKERTLGPPTLLAPTLAQHSAHPSGPTDVVSHLPLFWVRQFFFACIQAKVALSGIGLNRSGQKWPGAALAESGVGLNQCWLKQLKSIGLKWFGPKKSLPSRRGLREGTPPLGPPKFGHCCLSVFGVIVWRTPVTRRSTPTTLDVVGLPSLRGRSVEDCNLSGTVCSFLHFVKKKESSTRTDRALTRITFGS